MKLISMGMFFLVFKSAAYSNESLVIKRGKLLEIRGNVKILSLQDNEELRAAGVQEDDVVTSICGVAVKDTLSWQAGDIKLGNSTSCEIRVLRNSKIINLSYDRENQQP